MKRRGFLASIGMALAFPKSITLPSDIPQPTLDGPFIPLGWDISTESMNDILYVIYKDKTYYPDSDGTIHIPELTT